MRNPLRIMAVAAAAAICLAASAAAAQSPSGTAPFEQSREWNKLDPDVQQAYTDAVKGGDTGRRIDCFVRVEAPFDAGDRSFLFSHGYNVRTESGSVTTGYVAAKDLPSVAGLPFVLSIKSATKK